MILITVAHGNHDVFSNSERADADAPLVGTQDIALSGAERLSDNGHLAGLRCLARGLLLQ